MNTKAQSVLQAFEKLPLTDKQEVFLQIDRSLAEVQNPKLSEEPIHSARGMFAGSGLTKALLASRAEERRRG